MGHSLFAENNVYDDLKADFDNLQDSFIQEMRRYYPFFPMLPAIAVDDVEVNGYQIPKDSWVVLDLYGSNHDDRTINHAEQFDIERYVDNAVKISYEKEYEIIAHGGGKFREMHLCASESITLHNISVFADDLVNKHHFTVPNLHWEISMNQSATYPNRKVL